MPSLNIKALNDSPQDTLPVSAGAVFKDLTLDFSMESQGGNKALYGYSTKRDVKSDNDYKAISNSLVNIFNTTPGEKILNPTFGVNLARYLFEPISEEIAGVIGDVIYQGIELYEPRVSVKHIEVLADEDQSMYEINIHIAILALQGREFTFKGALSDAGLSTADY